MMSPSEALHTAARRYCIDRSDEWKSKYAEMAKRNERPAKSGLLKRLGLTVRRDSQEGLATFPRYKVLVAILLEVERRDALSFESLDEVRLWLLAAADAGFEEEARPPDFVMSMDDLRNPASFAAMQEAMQSLGRKATAVVGREDEGERKTRLRVMGEELESFRDFVSGRSADDLARVEPLPYRRTLSEAESQRLRSVLESRWGESRWYPHDRGADQHPPASTLAFRSEPFFDEALVSALQASVRQLGIDRAYELREGATSADCEIAVELLKPWYNLDEGFWFDESTDWLIYASHEGSVTIAGERLLPALQSVWRNWQDHIYSDAPTEVQRLVGPDVWSTSVDVEPPPGWDPPPDR
jgi:hypothetical protein